MPAQSKPGLGLELGFDVRVRVRVMLMDGPALGCGACRVGAYQIWG